MAGIVSLPANHSDSSGFLYLNDKYKNVNLALNVRDYIGDSTNPTLRQLVWFAFNNGKTASFSVTYTGPAGKPDEWTYKLQSMNDSIFGWTTHYTLTEDEIASYQDEDGIEFRVVRIGTAVELYLDGKQVCKGIDLTVDKNGNATGITANTSATIAIAHYGNLGHAVDIPFDISDSEIVEKYNTKLFYNNDKKTGVADPFVLDNTNVDGYYYLYGTQGDCCCYRSENMMDWEMIGNALDRSDSSEINRVLSADMWAAEVVYDASTELYYMFLSATPEEDTQVQGAESGTGRYLLLTATSKYPDREFRLVDFTDASSCGEEHVREYDTTTYPDYYAKYLLLDPASHAAFCKADKTYASRGGYIAAIDPHPFVDKNGDKYLFWTDTEGVNRMCGIKMKDWLTPDWDTATFVAWANYYTQEDYEASKTDSTVETVPYEQNANDCNEGTAVIEHNGKYYMTYSAGRYQDNTYQVNQAVADSPLGPYRKLTAEEGGVLLSADMTGNRLITGAGHHSFVTVGEQLYIVYHRHDDVYRQGAARHSVMDEVKWITIKDKDGNDLDVMYVNGATNTVQPKVEAYSDYKNIADEATVSGAETASYLTDGLLSIQKNGNAGLMQYIKETTISETTTFTFDFVSARTIGAVMVYNSKMEDTAFRNITKMEFVCIEDGKEVTRTIENIGLDSEYYEMDESDNITYIAPGAAAYAEINNWNVKTVKVTVEVPSGQASVGISEIKILGK